MKRGALLALAGFAVLLFAAAVAVRPSNQREWTLGQERLPFASFAGPRATIRNVRNFGWHKQGTATVRWENRSYDLNELETAWFILAPFDKDDRGPAHTFLSFGFADSQHISISVEARREVTEQYALLKGILRRFEIMYVVGDERDLIRLRANALRERPEFYNTITNNCTTNILAHANSISPGGIPYGREVLLPGYADELARRLRLIDDDATIQQVRTRYLVNARAAAFANSPDLSSRIRGA